MDDSKPMASQLNTADNWFLLFCFIGILGAWVAYAANEHSKKRDREIREMFRGFNDTDADR